jgi:hypothetical protein
LKIELAEIDDHWCAAIRSLAVRLLAESSIDAAKQDFDIEVIRRRTVALLGYTHSQLRLLSSDAISRRDEPAMLRIDRLLDISVDYHDTFFALSNNEPHFTVDKDSQCLEDYFHRDPSTVPSMEKLVHFFLEQPIRERSLLRSLSPAFPTILQRRRSAVANYFDDFSQQDENINDYIEVRLLKELHGISQRSLTIAGVD